MRVLLVEPLEPVLQGVGGGQRVCGHVLEEGRAGPFLRCSPAVRLDRVATSYVTYVTGNGLLISRVNRVTTEATERTPWSVVDAPFDSGGHLTQRDDPR